MTRFRHTRPILALLALAGTARSNPTFVVNAGSGADLVVFASSSQTFDSEPVPPSQAANVYAKLNGGPFLNSGNTTASLAYSFEIRDGDVLTLRRNSWGITATAVYGFDLLSGDGATKLYDGAVTSDNTNSNSVAAPSLTNGTPWQVTDPHDGSVWRLVFTAATSDSEDLVGGTSSSPGSGGDRVEKITFSNVTPPSADPAIRIDSHLRQTSGAGPMTITVPFSNTGTAKPLDVVSVAIGGSGAACFHVDSFTPSVKPGGVGDIQLTFTPAGHGAAHANVLVSTNDLSTPTAKLSLRVDTTDPAGIIPATAALWTRLVGAGNASRFDFSIRSAVDGRDTYTVSVVGGRVKVAGSSGVAMARGAYDYLRAQGYGMIGWTGARINLPVILPDLAETTVTPPGALQTYLNPVAYGYSTPYWDWSRWEREIDLMAIHGINLPLTLVAQEAIGERVWKRLGMTQAEIDTFMTGPAHLPWQRMGNICNHDGSLPASWHRDQVSLQHQILDRMRVLDIKPVVPSFAGFVPAALPRVAPGVSMVQTLWNPGFPSSKRPWFLLPTDPMFPKIAAMYQQEWRDEFGAADFFLCDSFNEIEVPTTGRTLAETLADYGDAIYRTITSGDPSAVWYIQGWMLGYQRNIWSDTTVAALLSRIPDDGVLIQDTACDYNANFWHNGMNWKLFNGFHGKRWTHGVIPNMGGKTAPTGIMAFYAGDTPATYADPACGRLSGAGYAGEGIEGNEVLFELVTDAAWSSQPLDPGVWIRRYCTNRYGACPPAMEQAWSLLRQTVYGTFTDHPTLGWQTGAPGYGSANRDQRIQEAVAAFLSCRGAMGDSPLYQADALEFTAFALGLHADQRFVQARSAFDAGDTTAGEAWLAQGMRILDELDRLLASHPLLRLDRWLDFARGHGDTTEETDAYEANARRIITSWGPPVNNYACRIWSGLVRDFYKPRIQAWFQAYRSGQSFNVNAWEQNWISSHGLSEPSPYADPVAAAVSVFEVARGESSQIPSGNADEVIGSWVPDQMRTSWGDLEWNLTTEQLRRMAGVVFAYQSGANRLEIQRVGIVADGQVVASLEQTGVAGQASVNNTYRLTIPAGIQANNSLVLRASVRSGGGTDSRGRILLLGNTSAGANVVKAPTGAELHDGASWIGGGTPGQDEIATWEEGSLGAGLVIASPVAWQGIAITNAASDLVIAGTGKLSLGAMGVDLSGARVDVTIAAPVELAAPQIWKLVAGRTLEVVGPVSGTHELRINSQSATSSYGSFLPAGTIPVTAFSDTSLADITSAAGSLGGGWVNNGVPLDATVCHFNRSGTAITYQLQAIDGNYTKCVKVELTQAGADIAARALYAKYIATKDLGYDFDNGGTAGTVAGSATSGGYGAATTRLASGAPSTGTVRLAGVNSHAGSIVVTDGTLELAAGARLLFRVTDSSANTLTGEGTVVLNGDFAVDVGQVTRTSGTWRLENATSLTGAYGASFRVVSPDGEAWTNLGPDKWRKDSGLLRFTFDEADGTLSVERLSFASWRDANAPGEAPDGDHDHDGLPNGIEYFMDSAGNGSTPNPALGSAGSISWPKARGYAGAYGIDFVVQTSPDLRTWSDVPFAGVTIKPDSLEYTLSDDDPRKFVRLKVSGPWGP